MLTLDSIITFYGKVHMLRGLSLQVNEGEIVTIIGANGAGKTTTVRTISGLIKPAAGRIEFLGTRIDGLPPEAICEMGIAHLPQGAGVFQKMTVLENLELGTIRHTNKSVTTKRMNEVFEVFPILEKRKKQLAATLSGGERQMLALGRALLTNPKLFIFDEPSFGLSPILVSEIAKIIEKLRIDGATILLVEQNARMALKIADRVYVLETGQVVLHGESSVLSGNEHIRRAYLGI